MCASNKRSGFSLIELILVIAIMGGLVGLLVPAVQKAREAMQRLTCASHLRQIGIAVHHHHNAHGVFPTNGGGVFPPEYFPAVDGSKFTPMTTEIQGQIVIHYWGLGNPKLGAREQTGSWAYSILPYIEQQNIFEAREWTQGVKIYTCPSRRTSEPQVPQNDEDGDYEGGGWPWGKIDYAANGLYIRGRGDTNRLTDCTDGSSQTILVGEKSLMISHYITGSWYYDEPFFLGGSFGTRRTGDLILRDSLGPLSISNWGSAHSAGANILFADGSVRLLNYDTPTWIVTALMTPDGGETIPDF
jgi:prepilin-type N-terminal cleavage/methylation domain-containing protein/prepilin-type processing-associated H-X9-DG protein